MVGWSLKWSMKCILHLPPRLYGFTMIKVLNTQDIGMHKSFAGIGPSSTAYISIHGLLPSPFGLTLCHHCHTFSIGLHMPWQVRGTSGDMHNGWECFM